MLQVGVEHVREQQKVLAAQLERIWHPSILYLQAWCRARVRPPPPPPAFTVHTYRAARSVRRPYHGAQLRRGLLSAYTACAFGAHRGGGCASRRGGGATLREGGKEGVGVASRCEGPQRGGGRAAERLPLALVGRGTVGGDADTRLRIVTNNKMVVHSVRSRWLAPASCWAAAAGKAAIWARHKSRKTFCKPADRAAAAGVEGEGGHERREQRQRGGASLEGSRGSRVAGLPRSPSHTAISSRLLSGLLVSYSPAADYTCPAVDVQSLRDLDSST